MDTFTLLVYVYLHTGINHRTTLASQLPNTYSLWHHDTNPNTRRPARISTVISAVPSMILETKRMRGFRAAGISRRNIHKFESPPKTVVTSTAIKISVFPIYGHSNAKQTHRCNINSKRVQRRN